MKKCKGCGVILQTENAKKVGYCIDVEQDYCQRCFRLVHYNDTSNLHANYLTNDKIFSIYNNHPKALFVLIIDIIEALTLENDNLLDYFKDKKLLIIINKSDLLPSNINDKKIIDIFNQKLSKLHKKYPNIKDAIVTNIKESYFNEQFFELIDNYNYNEIVFAGRANAGKSSLINKIFKDKSLTISMYPGTTLDEVVREYDKYQFIDTPGLYDETNYNSYLTAQEFKLMQINKTIKPQIFQLYEAQSYFYDGLMRIDYEPNNRSSIMFFISNNQKIHRTSFLKSNDYYNKNYDNFILKRKPLLKNYFYISNQATYIIKGLGIIKLKGKGSVSIYLPEKIKIYQSEDNI